MTFISFAQNFEDIVLWRALSDVQDGFYIDVGANDPIEDSVTLAFYERGWYGINVEPVEEHFIDLARERPRDINLACALGDKPGRLTLYEVNARGLATNDEKVAGRYRDDGRIAREREVEVTTLASICEEHAPADIHFLKIDVEGFERNVLLGGDFSRFRPWILVIESTKPNSPVDNSVEWEAIVLAAKYEFAYFDGLNKFYVAQERGYLKSRLALAPNVFDRAKLRHGHCFVQDSEVTRSEFDNLRAQFDKQAQLLETTQAELAARTASLAELAIQREILLSEKARAENLQNHLEREMLEHNRLKVAVAELRRLPLVRIALALHSRRVGKAANKG